MERANGRAPRRIVVLVVIAALATGFAPSGARAGTPRHTLLEMINRSRSDHDLRRVKLNRSLSKDAQGWSWTMLRKNRVYDPPNLRDILAPYNWDDVGADSVGCGATLHKIHETMMRDRSHRAIILHPRVRRVGIGVVRADRKNRCGHRSFWVSEFYYG
jgi:uncharacterized protein YkwD